MFVRDYHDVTKHHFNRFARSLGYLDWATQPNPFRRYAGAPVVDLPRTPLRPDVPYRALFDGSAVPQSVDVAAIGEFLRCAMGLSAWKSHRGARWELRVNPSSGNLHPTEAYVVHEGRVCHYAPREHALEERCVVEPAAWRAFTGDAEGFLVGLTSIVWREAWKYGERAFRYCQHDVGHAIGALRVAAALLGWRLTLLPRWSDTAIETLLGVNREADAAGAEREEGDCLAVVTPGPVDHWRGADPEPLALAAAGAVWRGTANRLSPQQTPWPVIDRVAGATRYPGLGAAAPGVALSGLRQPTRHAGDDQPARTIVLRRRSAVAFDGRSSLPRETWLAMLERLLPGAPPWDALDWLPHVHLVLFVHRVDGVTPGVYAFLRDTSMAGSWRAALRPECLWEPVVETGDLAGRLFLLLPADVRSAANRLSCDQEIASDGFFSLGMLARFEASLRERGPWFYRRLFWECGLVGQVLYLEAEAVGARSTGIGCFYDDAVHATLGLAGHEWQSLYHFSMGMPVEDTRLTTEPGYRWEQAPSIDVSPAVL